MAPPVMASRMLNPQAPPRNLDFPNFRLQARNLAYRNAHAPVVINRQSGGRTRGRKRPGFSLRAARNFSYKLCEKMGILGLMRGHFDVALVNDAAMAKLNLQFRGKAGPTDILSFPWPGGDRDDRAIPVPKELAGFLGDIVISVEAAQRNAATEEHSLQTEIHQLVLHGALHLCGYDHETDQGEMNMLELRLRKQLDIEGTGGRRKKLTSRKREAGRKG